MRYTGPKLKILRRLKLDSLPGLSTKAYDPIFKKKIKRFKKRKRPSLFSKRLLEKQKLRYNFGISNHQFFNYVKEAKRTSDSTGERLLKLLEMRFDSIIFRLNLAPTINAAKQLISHGHFLINKKKINIPSYQCNVKDEISVRPKSQKFFNEFLEKMKKMREKNKKFFFKKGRKIKQKGKARIYFPDYLKFNRKTLIGTITENISLKDQVLYRYYKNLSLRILYVIEFYSRKL